MGDIEATNRVYPEDLWRRITREEFSDSPPKDDADTEARISKMIDFQQVRPGSAIEARRIARDELRKIKK